MAYALSSCVRWGTEAIPDRREPPALQHSTVGTEALQVAHGHLERALHQLLVLPHQHGRHRLNRVVLHEEALEAPLLLELARDVLDLVAFDLDLLKPRRERELLRNFLQVIADRRHALQILQLTEALGQ